LRERGEARLKDGIVFVARHEHADAPHARALLPPRWHRPRRRAAEKRDELAPPQLSKLHPLPPNQASEHNRLMSSKSLTAVRHVDPAHVRWGSWLCGNDFRQGSGATLM
jgi:hypothetical protein